MENYYQRALENMTNRWVFSTEPLTQGLLLNYEPKIGQYCTLIHRHEIRPRPIMLKILSIMLLSIAQKSSLLCSKLCFQNQDYVQELTILLEYLDLISANCE